MSHKLLCCKGFSLYTFFEYVSFDQQGAIYQFYPQYHCQLIIKTNWQIYLFKCVDWYYCYRSIGYLLCCFVWFDGDIFYFQRFYNSFFFHIAEGKNTVLSYKKLKTIQQPFGFFWFFPNSSNENLDLVQQKLLLLSDMLFKVFFPLDCLSR